MPLHKRNTGHGVSVLRLWRCFIMTAIKRILSIILIIVILALVVSVPGLADDPEQVSEGEQEELTDAEKGRLIVSLYLEATGFSFTSESPDAEVYYAGLDSAVDDYVSESEDYSTRDDFYSDVSSFGTWLDNLDGISIRQLSPLLDLALNLYEKNVQEDMDSWLFANKISLQDGSQILIYPSDVNPSIEYGSYEIPLKSGSSDTASNHEIAFTFSENLTIYIGLMRDGNYVYKSFRPYGAGSTYAPRPYPTRWHFAIDGNYLGFSFISGNGVNFTRLTALESLFSSDSSINYDASGAITPTLPEGQYFNISCGVEFSDLRDMYDNYPTQMMSGNTVPIYKISPVAGDVLPDSVDIPDVEVPDISDIDFGDMGLKDKFPFCIPFDLYLMLSVLAANRVCPSFDCTLDFGILGEYPMHIDLSDFEPVVGVLRTMELLLFCVGLMFTTLLSFSC